MSYLINIKTKFNEYWNDVLSFFRYSHTILLARLTVITGVITAILGSLDWSPLLSLDINTGFSKAQVMWLGFIMVIKGGLDEIARRAKGTQPADL